MLALAAAEVTTPLTEWALNMPMFSPSLTRGAHWLVWPHHCQQQSCSMPKLSIFCSYAFSVAIGRGLSFERRQGRRTPPWKFFAWTVWPGQRLGYHPVVYLLMSY